MAGARCNHAIIVGDARLDGGPSEFLDHDGDDLQKALTENSPRDIDRVRAVKRAERSCDPSVTQR